MLYTFIEHALLTNDSTHYIRTLLWFLSFVYFQIFSCMLDALLKKKINCEYAHAYRLMITLYLWMQIIIILIKSSNVVSKFYRLINTDTFNHLFFNSLNHLKNKSALICMYRISSNNPLTLTCTLTRISALSLGQHIKQPHPPPPSNKRPLLR